MLIWFSVSCLFAAILKFLYDQGAWAKSYPWCKASQKTNVRHPEMQIYDHSPHVIVMDIRAFLLSNKTTKDLKRASDDSAGGSTSTCKSSSKRKFVRTWLKDFPWLTYDVEANQIVEFSKIYYCIVTKHTRQDAFKFFLCCSFY